MFESIAAGEHAAGADDADGRVEPLVEGVHIGQSRGFDVFAADAAEAVFGADDHGFVFHIQAVADGIDAVHKFEREFVENSGGLVEVDDIEIGRQLDAQRLAEIGKGIAEDFFRGFKIVGNLRLARHVGTGKVELGEATKAALLHFAQEGVGFAGRHAHQGEEEGAVRLAVLQVEQVVEVVIDAVVGQAHGVDAAQRHVAVARLGVAGARLEGGGFGHEAAGGGVFHFFQFGNAHAGHTGGVHEAVVERKTGNPGLGAGHGCSLIGG